MDYYQKGKSISDFNFIFTIDAYLRSLLNLKEFGSKELICKSGAYIDLFSLFDENNILYMFIDDYKCICAIIDDKLLMIEIKKQEDKKQEICKISLFPNVDNKLVEKPDENSYKARIVDGLGNIYNNWWLCCAKAQIINEQKFPLTIAIKSICYEDISKRIFAVKNRQQLLDKVVALDDENVFKVLSYINENLENNNKSLEKLLLGDNSIDRSNVLIKTL